MDNFAASFGLTPNQRHPPNMDRQLVRDRVFIQHKIFDIFVERHRQLTRRWPSDIARIDYADITDFCEHQLFRMSVTRDEYMNLQTLEIRVGEVFSSGVFERLFKRRPSEEDEEGASGPPVNLARRMVMAVEPTE